MLSAVGPMLPDVAQQIAARAGAGTAMPTLLRSLDPITDQIASRLTAQLGTAVERVALLHCLVTTSAASAGINVTDVLAALGSADLAQ